MKIIIISPGNWNYFIVTICKGSKHRCLLTNSYSYKDINSPYTQYAVIICTYILV